MHEIKHEPKANNVQSILQATPGATLLEKRVNQLSRELYETRQQNAALHQLFKSFARQYRADSFRQAAAAKVSLVLTLLLLVVSLAIMALG